MSTITQTTSSILADLGASLIFGLGFFFFKKKFTSKDKDGKELKDKMKPLKEKIEDTINKWERSVSLQKINSLIKHDKEINAENFDPITVLDQLREKNIEPDISTINTLLDCCNRLRDIKNFKRMKEIILSEEQPLASPNIITFNIMLKELAIETADNMDICLKTKQDIVTTGINEILAEIEKRKLSPNDITINTLIDITIENQLFDLAWKYFDNMQSVYGIEPDIYTYSTLLKSIKNFTPEERYIDRAFQILKMVKLSQTKGIRSDEILYNCIIDTCVKYHKIDQAQAIFDDMIASNIAPSQITFSLMIQGYGSVYDLEKCFILFQKMKSENIKPNEIVYGCLLNACVKNNNIEKACRLYDEICSNSAIEMNLILYTTLMKGYAKSKEFNKAYDIYIKLLSNPKEKINIVAYNAILDACVECNQFEEMTNIYEHIKTKAIEDETSPQPDLITYSTVIKGYSKMRNINKVLDIYNFLKTRNDLVLDEITFNSVIDALNKSQKFEEALQVYEEMIKHNITLSNATYSIMIKIYSKMNNIDKSLEIFNDMTVKKNLKPSLITFTSILQVLIKSKRIQQAIEIFNHVLESGMHPDQVLFNVIINGCVYNGRLEEACTFLKESFKENIKLCSDVYKNVLNNLCTNRMMKIEHKNELCVFILGTLKEKGYYLDEEIYNKVLRMVYKNSQTIEKDMNKHNKKYKGKNYEDEYEEGQVDDYNYKKKNYSNNKRRNSNQKRNYNNGNQRNTYYYKKRINAKKYNNLNNKSSSSGNSE